MTEVELREVIKNKQSWTVAKKRDIEVWAKLVEPGLTIKNVIQETSKVSSDKYNVVLSGVLEEQWIISYSRLCERYLNIDGSRIVSLNKLDYKNNGWTRVKPNVIDYKYFCIRVPIEIKNFEIGSCRANNTNTPYHHGGDFLVCDADDKDNPNIDDIWVVTNVIFRNKYYVDGVIPLDSFETPDSPPRGFIVE